eukprot:GHVR01123100.1.p1 GENE.GHVR01123100.1~~GHVR01123100.1.p1  ORF type:complete len:292 (+),score=74.62 GHVR01123100.1:64-939(+)
MEIGNQRTVSNGTADTEVRVVVPNVPIIENANTPNVDGLSLLDHNRPFEEGVNMYFSRMYTGQMTVDEVLIIINQLLLLPKETDDYKLAQAMINTVFEECKYYPRYPTRELYITSELFGKLIISDILLSNDNKHNFVLALRCVAESLRKPPNSRMFRFGVSTLLRFFHRCGMYPGFCQLVLKINTFKDLCPQHHLWLETVSSLVPTELVSYFHIPEEKYNAIIDGVELPPVPEQPDCTLLNLLKTEDNKIINITDNSNSINTHMYTHTHNTHIYIYTYTHACIQYMYKTYF